jgi:hypothetical protein
MLLAMGPPCCRLGHLSLRDFRPTRTSRDWLLFWVFLMFLVGGIVGLRVFCGLLLPLSVVCPLPCFFASGVVAALLFFFVFFVFGGLISGHPLLRVLPFVAVIVCGVMIVQLFVVFGPRGYLCFDLQDQVLFLDSFSSLDVSGLHLQMRCLFLIHPMNRLNRHL